MPRPVYEEHFGATFQLSPEGAHLIKQISAGTMDENQRRQVCILRARDMYGIHPEAADVGQLADIGKSLFELAHFICGITDGGCDGSEKSGDFGDHGSKQLQR
jgi:hypothetical protein